MGTLTVDAGTITEVNRLAHAIQNGSVHPRSGEIAEYLDRIWTRWWGLVQSHSDLRADGSATSDGRLWRQGETTVLFDAVAAIYIDEEPPWSFTKDEQDMLRQIDDWTRSVQRELEGRPGWHSALGVGLVVTVFGTALALWTRR